MYHSNGGLRQRDGQPFTLTFTLMGNLESPVNLTPLIVKQEYSVWSWHKATKYIKIYTFPTEAQTSRQPLCESYEIPQSQRQLGNLQ